MFLSSSGVVRSDIFVSEKVNFNELKTVFHPYKYNRFR